MKPQWQLLDNASASFTLTFCLFYVMRNTVAQSSLVGSPELAQIFEIFSLNQIRLALLSTELEESFLRAFIGRVLE